MTSATNERRNLNLKHHLAVSIPVLLWWILIAPTSDWTIFNQDIGIQVLMSVDFRLPEDAYYWGQNRTGSLLPLLSSGLVSLGVDPLWSAAILLCGFLSVGFVTLSASMSQRSRIWFAWFYWVSSWVFPLGFLGFPFAPQFACLGLAVWGLDRLPKRNWQAIHCFWITLCLGVAMWVSETSLLAIVAIVAVALNRIRKHSQSEAFRRKFGANVSAIALAIGLSVWRIAIAKQNSTSEKTYGALNALTEVQTVAIATYQTTVRLLFRLEGEISGQGQFPLLATLCAWSAIAVIGFAAWGWRKQPKFSPWLISVLLSLFVGSWVIWFTVRWVLLNQLSPRYLTSAYVVLCWWMSIGIDLLQSRARQWAKLAMVLLLTFWVGWAIQFSIDTQMQNLPQARSPRLAEFRSWNGKYVIGDVWTTYLVCVADPRRLECAPHDRSLVRGKRMLDRVLSAIDAGKPVYLIQELWLDTFPAQITQYERVLVKAGTAERVGQYTLAPYRKQTKKP